MTACTFIRRPDDLLARMWPDAFPGRAADPRESDDVTPALRPQPKTPIEVTLAFRWPPRHDAPQRSFLLF